MARNRRRNIVILGATGSIGDNALAVLRKHPDSYRLMGVAAHSNEAGLDAVADEFAVPHKELFASSGMEGLMRMATLAEAEVVLVATTGTYGMLPALAALEAGKTVALASKEAVVYGGALFMEQVRAAPGQLIPVDSEHNALFQCLIGRDPATVERLILTASGGPFLRFTRREMAAVTVDAALAHPNWQMGPKITVDSATMANKGLELIEARWLFDVAPEQLQVVIHPQSIVHSMVAFRDGTVMAQAARPSMMLPIQFAFDYPLMQPAACERMDFSKIQHWEFRPPDLRQFPCLRLAMEAMAHGGLAPAVFNTANQVAVGAFLQKRCGYLAIPRLIEHCLSKLDIAMPDSLEALVEMEPVLLETATAALSRFSHSNLT